MKIVLDRVAKGARNAALPPTSATFRTGRGHSRARRDGTASHRARADRLGADATRRGHRHHRRRHRLPPTMRKRVALDRRARRVRARRRRDRRRNRGRGADVRRPPRRIRSRSSRAGRPGRSEWARSAIGTVPPTVRIGLLAELALLREGGGGTRAHLTRPPRRRPGRVVAARPRARRARPRVLVVAGDASAAAIAAAGAAPNPRPDDPNPNPNRRDRPTEDPNEDPPDDRGGVPPPHRQPDVHRRAHRPDVRAGALRRPLPVGQPEPVRRARPASRPRSSWTTPARRSTASRQLRQRGRGRSSSKDGSFDWHACRPARPRAASTTRSTTSASRSPPTSPTALASASGKTPHRATVNLTTNDTNSYLASTIGQQAAEKIRTSIVKKVNQQAAEQFLLGLANIRSNLVTAVDGADKLVDGSATAQSGAATLADGTAQLSAGAQQLSAGNCAARDRRRTRSPTARAQVADGNRQLAAKADQAGAAAAQVAARAAPRAADILDQLQAAGADPGAARRRSTAALDELGTTVQSGNTQVQGARRPGRPALRGREPGRGGQRAGGRRRRSRLRPERRSSRRALSRRPSGAAQLRDGLGTLHDGTAQLRDGLKDGVASIPDNSPDAAEEAGGHDRRPGEPRRTRRSPRPGPTAPGSRRSSSRSPAWIGIYALFLIVKPVSRRAITALHSPIKITLAGWLTPGLLGAIQMVGLFAVGRGRARGSGSQNPLGMFGMMAIGLPHVRGDHPRAQRVARQRRPVPRPRADGAAARDGRRNVPVADAARAARGAAPRAADVVSRSTGSASSCTAATRRRRGRTRACSALWMLVALLLAAIGVTRMTHFRTLRDLRPSADRRDARPRSACLRRDVAAGVRRWPALG